MTTLLRIEWCKIRYYRAFWWVLGITAVTYPAMSYFMLMICRKVTDQLPAETRKAFLGNPFGFNEVWHTVAYCSSMFIIIPAIVVIMLPAAYSVAMKDTGYHFEIYDEKKRPEQ